jgi:hypothetical protein
MRREGFEVNGKRVARIRREEEIKVSKKNNASKPVSSNAYEGRRVLAFDPGQRSVRSPTTNERRIRAFSFLSFINSHSKDKSESRPGCEQHWRQFARADKHTYGLLVLRAQTLHACLFPMLFVHDVAYAADIRHPDRSIRDLPE